MSTFFGSFSSGPVPQGGETLIQKVRRHIKEGEYTQEEEILLDQEKKYKSMPGGRGGIIMEAAREFYTRACYCFGDLYRAQKQWDKAVQYYQEGLELFKQCELHEGFDDEDLKKQTVDARKNMNDCSDRATKD